VGGTTVMQALMLLLLLLRLTVRRGPGAGHARQPESSR